MLVQQADKGRNTLLHLMLKVHKHQDYGPVERAAETTAICI